VANLTGEEIPQIYCLCGRGPRSSLAVLRPGLAVTELAVSPLPGAPTAVWTIKRQPDDEYDAYIVVSFSNATIVFSIGDEVKEVSDSGFLATTPTLHTQVLADGAMLQVGGRPAAGGCDRGVVLTGGCALGTAALAAVVLELLG
jgi:splicing factor 3B subunit 3